MTPVIEHNRQFSQRAKKSARYGLGRFIAVLTWIAAIVGAAIGAFILVFGMSSAKNAIQETTVAATACAVAVIPYVIARSATEIFNLVRADDDELRS